MRTPSAEKMARKLLRDATRKKRQQTKRTQQARRLRWMEKHPESPITLKYRQQAEEAALIKMADQTYRVDKARRMLARRLNDSMQSFASRFRLAPEHPAGIIPVDPLGVALVKQYPGGWKACFKARRIDPAKVVAYLRGDAGELPFARRWLAVKLTHSFDGVHAYLVPRDELHEILGFRVPALAVFQTANDYRALFVIRTGHIIESARTYDRIIVKLKRKSKRDWQTIFETAKTAPEAPTIKTR